MYSDVSVASLAAQMDWLRVRDGEEGQLKLLLVAIRNFRNRLCRLIGNYVLCASAIIFITLLRASLCCASLCKPFHSAKSPARKLCAEVQVELHLQMSCSFQMRIITINAARSARLQKTQHNSRNLQSKLSYWLKAFESLLYLQLQRYGLAVNITDNFNE